MCLGLLFILVGYKGFVFIIFNNFCLIMKYNNLIFYVMVVGYLVE